MSTPQNPPKGYRWVRVGKARASDQALYADYRMDCEAKKRWHRMPGNLIGKDIAKLLRRFRHLSIRRIRTTKKGRKKK